MNRIMFTGPHAIGKTTTAKKLAEKLGGNHLFIPSFVGAVATKCGFDLNKPHTVNQLFSFQNRVFDTYEMSYEATSQVATVYDRSPVDFIAYMTLALRDKPEYATALKAYVDRCLDLTNKYCTMLVIPRADVSETYEAKHNRPDFTEEQVRVRSDYYDIIDYYLDRVHKKIHVVDIPVEYQFDKRLNFILEYINEWFRKMGKS